MADFLKNKAKIIILIYGVIIFVALLFGLYYMTRYANVHIGYQLSNGVETFRSDLGISTFVSNTDLFQYFDNAVDSTSPVLKGITQGTNTVVSAGYAKKIYDFQVEMSSFNTLIFVLLLIAIICFAIMLVFSNQSRKIYYKDNLAVGILMPFVVIILNLILMIKNFSLMGTFNENVDLFKTTAFLMNPDSDAGAKQLALKEGGYQYIVDGSSNVNSTTFIIATAIFAIVMVASVLMIIYTIYRYKECAKRRGEIIERAANKND